MPAVQVTPTVGEVRKAYQIGYAGATLYIGTECSSCGRAFWARLYTGRTKCYRCNRNNGNGNRAPYKSTKEYNNGFRQEQTYIKDAKKGCQYSLGKNCLDCPFIVCLETMGRKQWRRFLTDWKENGAINWRRNGEVAGN